MYYDGMCNRHSAWQRHQPSDCWDRWLLCWGPIIWKVWFKSRSRLRNLLVPFWEGYKQIKAKVQNWSENKNHHRFLFHNWQCRIVPWEVSWWDAQICQIMVQTSRRPKREIRDTKCDAWSPNFLGSHSRANGVWRFSHGQESCRIQDRCWWGSCARKKWSKIIAWNAGDHQEYFGAKQ